MFHQVDGLCVDAHADLAALKATCERVLAAVLGTAPVRWHDCDFGFVDQGFELAAEIGGRESSFAGCGLLKADTLREAGFDPEQVKGYAFGFGLERLATVKFGIDNVRALWQPPYIPG